MKPTGLYCFLSQLIVQYMNIWVIIKKISGTSIPFLAAKESGDSDGSAETVIEKQKIQANKKKQRLMWEKKTRKSSDKELLDDSSSDEEDNRTTKVG